jgi:methionyl-tRNA formyltransferase
MGTSEFAVPCLEALLASHQVVAVITAPDKPAGRALKLSESPVKTLAKRRNLPILQPDDLRDPFFLRAIAGYEADAAAVVAFRILPPELFTIPRLGCVNLHASLLPDLRGAAPIQWALMRGRQRTGVTTFLIERKVDTGNILMQESTLVEDEDNVETLSKRLSEIGSILLVRTFEKLGTNKLKPRAQTGEATSAPKITHETALIDWSHSALQIHNQVRGLSPHPAAFTTLNCKVLKILRTRIHSAQCKGEPGEIISMAEGEVEVATGEGSIKILELQLEGKKRLFIEEFLRGRQLVCGTRLG